MHFATEADMVYYIQQDPVAVAFMAKLKSVTTAAIYIQYFTNGNVKPYPQSFREVGGC